ncbi:MAG TPA: hypothetical protein VLP43_09750 [Solirubrobacteraceae bacterium]|nr:hypothetical protein [Solirubrobacteraceae bacterium]
MTGWSSRKRWTVVAGVAAVALTGCGGGSRQDVSEASGHFPVTVTFKSFPPIQRLAEHTNLVLAVRNSGRKAIPNVAVTICNTTCAVGAPAGEGASVSAFGANSKQTGLASASRPVWIVDRPPGICGYSCKSGGPGSAVTAYTNTWALGRVAPGRTVVFKWGVTAVKTGAYTIAYQVAAGLNGKAKAVAADGTLPSGVFHVAVAKRPAQAYVNNSGAIVTKP